MAFPFLFKLRNIGSLSPNSGLKRPESTMLSRDARLLSYFSFLNPNVSSSPWAKPCILLTFLLLPSGEFNCTRALFPGGTARARDKYAPELLTFMEILELI